MTLKAFEYLKGHIQDASYPDFIPRLYKELQDAKSAVHHLSSRDLLRKDFKKWILGTSSLGISSVMWNLEEWMAREARQDLDWFHCLPHFAKENQLDISCIMTAYCKTGTTEFCRQLVIGIHSDFFARESILQSLRTSELELEPLLQISREGIHVFQQKNVTASRKQVHPILSGILEEYVNQSRI